mmetsp:Transcript_31427/g.61261  ORF Transcript_31427/g.61261 Transcript_31427/m.61261 type:complete len:445 (-) Transcript_31427:171-1505(-)|eukprot:CAMPEP_0175163236 /NCGR_PEP_ID=MMETSP0087-20121206/25632_1 /TAXON_ID=136419 /ORGANISM="Unknown Unknown, Strain D1" /LENGTH=444 /DNA_ID=CAMNT_0016451907 /DNA_START=32 /DNA_END=1366 /DNA_ORIENTATION=+
MALASLVSVLAPILFAVVQGQGTSDTNAVMTPTGPPLFPLGHGMAKETVHKVKKWPHAMDFYSDYVQRKIPVVIEQGSTAQPAFSKYTDQFLQEKRGRVEALWQKGAKESTKDKFVIGNMSTFISTYSTDDLWLRKEFHDELYKDFVMPLSLMCGWKHDWITQLFLSKGSMSTLLQQTADNSLYCALDGSLSVLLVSAHSDDSHTAELADSTSKPGHCKADVDAVNLTAYPQLSDATYSLATLDKGDCVYVPHDYFHHIRSGPSRSLVFSVLWGNNEDFDAYECEALDDSGHVMHENVTLSEAQMSVRPLYSDDSVQSHFREELLTCLFEEHDHVHDENIEVNRTGIALCLKDMSKQVKEHMPNRRMLTDEQALTGAVEVLLAAGAPSGSTATAKLTRDQFSEIPLEELEESKLYRTLLEAAVSQDHEEDHDISHLNRALHTEL